MGLWPLYSLLIFIYFFGNSCTHTVIVYFDPFHYPLVKPPDLSPTPDRPFLLNKSRPAFMFFFVFFFVCLFCFIFDSWSLIRVARMSMSEKLLTGVWKT